MRAKIIGLFLALFLTTIFAVNTNAQTVELITNNIRLVGSAPYTTLQFDFYIKNTSASAWTMSTFQGKWTFTNALLNGGTPTFTLVPSTTQFTGGLPTNVTTAGASPNIYLRSIPGLPSAAQSIPANTQLLYGTFQLVTSNAAGFDLAQMPTLQLSTLAGQTTAIYYWNGATQTQITGANRVITNPTDAPLPIQLASFNGNVFNKHDIKLSWKTTQEINNYGFDIERKQVSGQWTKVAFVGGKGNSNAPVSYTYEDIKVNTGKYNYRLKQIDNNGNYEYYNLDGTIEVGIPNKYDISQNYPNPFNPTTKIDFDLPKDSKVNITIYDMTGKAVKTLVNEARSAGYYTVTFDAANISSGTYFYRMTTDGDKSYVVTKKLVVVK